MTRSSTRSIAAALALAAAAVAPLPNAHAAPANDDLRDARDVRIQTTAFGSLAGATRQRGEPNHASASGRETVWYRFRADRAGPVAFSTCATRTDTTLAVYTGTGVRTLDEVASNDDHCHNLGSRVAFDAVPGRTYLIAVSVFEDARPVAGGRFQLAAVQLEPPANDALADAPEVQTRRRYMRSTEAATAESGEPRHAGEEPHGSVWFRFTADRTERISVVTDGSTFDTVLAVYRGTSLRSLRPVAENDDAVGETLSSRVVFRAVRGRTYTIAVDGFDGDVGEAVLLLLRG